MQRYLITVPETEQANNLLNYIIQTGYFERVDKIEEELLDRFSKLPESAKNLMYITKLRTSFTGTSVTSVSIIGSELKIMLSDFLPFSSVQKLISSVNEKMVINNFTHNFSPSKSGFKISVNADNLEHSFMALKIFVGLFSK